MSTKEVILEIPLWIAKGLASGKYERCGSVIRDASTKVIVKMLDEVPHVAKSSGKVVMKKIIIPVASAVGTVASYYVISHKDDVKEFVDDKLSKVFHKKDTKEEKSEKPKTEEKVVDFNKHRKNA